MNDYYYMHYTCESGAICKAMIPENATESDLQGIRELLDIVIERHFKKKLGEVGETDGNGI